MDFDWETHGTRALQVLPDGAIVHDGEAVIWANERAREIVDSESVSLDMFELEERPELLVLPVGRLAAIHVEVRWIPLEGDLELILFRRCSGMPNTSFEDLADLEERLLKAERSAETADMRFRRIYEKSGRAVEMADELEERAARSEEAKEEALERMRAAEESAVAAERRAEEANIRFRRIYEMSGVEELEKRASEAEARAQDAASAQKDAEEARRAAESESNRALQRLEEAEKRWQETEARFQLLRDAGESDPQAALVSATAEAEARSSSAEGEAERLREELRRALTTNEAARWRSERLEKQVANLKERLNKAELANREIKDRLRLLARNDQLPHTLAFEDPVTGLPRLEMVLVFAEKNYAIKEELALILLDVKKFRGLNDTLGNQTGDELLKQVGQRLRMAVGKDEVVGRWEQDRFVVLMPADSDELVQERGELLLQCFEEPFEAAGQQIGLQVAGAAAREVFRNRNSLDALLRNAWGALRQGKRDQSGWTFHSEELAEGARMRRRLELELNKALEQEQFLLHYQPIYSLDEQKIVGLEGLLRWQHPRDGLVGPGRFLEAAEELGLILEIGDQVSAPGLQSSPGAPGWAICLSEYRSATAPSG